MPKRYTVSSLRANLARALDEVERGDPVAVERRGQRFRIVPDERPAKWPKNIKPFVEVLDPRLLEEGWTWEWRGPGKPMRLKIGGRTRKSR